MTAAAKAEAGEPLLVDARGMRCPWPVLRAARAMRLADAVIVHADDPVAETDIPAMAAARSWHCRTDQAPDFTRFFLNRAARD